MNGNALRAFILLGALLATARAQATASSSAAQDPAESVKFYKKGIELRDDGKLQAAAESFKKAIEINPNWRNCRTKSEAILVTRKPGAVGGGLVQRRQTRRRHRRSSRSDPSEAGPRRTPF